MKDGNKFISNDGELFMCLLCGEVFKIGEYNEGYYSKCSKELKTKFNKVRNDHIKNLRRMCP